ncbi:Uncharacterised protein [Actinobacillus pleuropneumoniae]|nr:Uncharacterised protein [Actinobacillus pleuropneumoniae]
MLYLMIKPHVILVAKTIIISLSVCSTQKFKETGHNANIRSFYELNLIRVCSHPLVEKLHRFISRSIVSYQDGDSSMRLMENTLDLLGYILFAVVGG